MPKKQRRKSGNPKFRINLHEITKSSLPLDPGETEKAYKTAQRRRPNRLNVHPGELLREEFMKPLGLTAEKMARAIPRHPVFGLKFDIAREINDLIRADPRISLLDLDLALALDRYFGLNAGYWWHVQATYEVRLGMTEDAAWLDKIRPLKR